MHYISARTLFQASSYATALRLSADQWVTSTARLMEADTVHILPGVDASFRPPNTGGALVDLREI